MNNQRRRELTNVANEIACINDATDFGTLESIKSDIEMILMDEEMAFESMPENLQYSMRGEASQEAQDNMNEAIDTIDEYISDAEGNEPDPDLDEEELEDFNDEINDAFEDMKSTVIDLLETAAM